MQLQYISHLDPPRYHRSMEVSIWENAAVRDRLDEIVAEYEETLDNYELVMAQIPGLFGESEKATYLGFRAVGLSSKQALEVLGLPQSVMEEWRKETPWMEKFEVEKLYELQGRVGAELVRLGFLRNMTMFLFRDSLVIRKSLSDMENMTKREFDYLRTCRRFYSTSDLLNLERAVAPEKHRTNTLVLNFGDNNMFEVVEAEPGDSQIRLIEGDKSE